MKFSIKSLFRKVKLSESLETQTALPPDSVAICAMALLTASVIFLQGPLALAAVIEWNPIASSGTFSTGAGGAWSSGGAPAGFPGTSDTARFNLFTSDYTVLLDGSQSVDGLATSLSNGTAGTTVTLSGLPDGTSILQLGAAGIQTTAGSLRLDAALTVTLGGAQTWNVGGATALTVAGTLIGTEALTKDGAGELTLSGVNTFSGATTVNAGTLTLGGNAALASSASVTVNGAGILNLATSQEIVSLAGSGVANIQGKTLTVNGIDSTIFSGTVRGAGGSLVKNESGVLTLSGANTFDGGVTLNGGAIEAGHDAALGAGTLTFTGGRLSSDSTTARTISNALSLSGELTLGDAINNGAVTLSGAAALTAETTLIVESAGTLSGVVGGTSILTKNGFGVLTLSGANTFDGGVTLNEGAIEAGNEAALGTGTLIFNGGRLSSDSATARTLANQLLLTGNLALGDAINNGSLTLTGNADLTGATTLTVASAATLGGVVSGAFDLVKNGAAELTLTGANTFTGSTTVEVGTLTLTSGGSLAGAVVGVNAGAVLNASGNLPLAIATVLTADGVVNFSSPGVILETLLGSGTVNLTSTVLTVQNGTFSGAINEGGTPGSLVKASTGLLTLSGLNGYTGTTSVQAGTLTLASGGTLTSAAVSVSVGATLNAEVDSRLSSATVLTADGVVNLSNPAVALVTMSGSGTVTLNSTELRLQGGIFGGAINDGVSGFGSLVKTGAGELILSGLNSYTGNTSVEAGSLTLAAGGTLSGFEVGVSAGATLNSKVGSELSSATVLTANGVVNLFTTEVALVILVGSGTVNLDTTALTVQSGSFTGVIKDGAALGSLVKVSADTLILSGASTYTGGTSLNEGTLSVGHNSALGSGTLNVADGATLDAAVSGLSLSNHLGLNGTLNFQGTNSLTISGSVSLGAVSGINVVGNALTLDGAVSGNSDFTKSGSGTLTLNGANTLTGPVSVNTGTLSIGAGGTVGSLPNAASFSVASGATLQSNRSDDLVLSQVISGEGSLVKAGAGITTLSGENTYSGGTSVNAGTLIVSVSGSLAAGSNLTVAVDSFANLNYAGAILGTLNNSGNVIFNGGGWTTQTGLGTVTAASGVLSAVNGTGSLVINGGARAIYSAGANLFSVVNSGSLSFAADSSIHTITSTGTLTHTGGLTISGEGSIASLSGGASSSLTKSGTGTLTLGGTYLGTTSVTGGTLSLNAGALLNGDVTVSGGRLVLGGTNQFGGNLTLASGMIDLGGHNQILAGSFSASGGILGVVGETGKLTASAVNQTGGTMNVTPAITLSGIGSSEAVVPELTLSGSSLIPVTATIRAVYVEAVKLNGSNHVLVLTGTAGAPSTTALSISGNNNTVQFTQGFAPTRSVELTVGGAGSTGSVLKVGGEGLVLNSGKLSGHGTIEGNVTLGAGANFAPGNSPGVMTIAGTLIANGATLSIEFDRTAPFGVQQDQVRVTAPGMATINGGTLSLNLGTGASRFRPGVDTFYPVFISSGSAATGAQIVTAGTGFSTLIAPAGFGFSLVNGLLVLPNSGSSSGFSKIGASGNLAAVGSLVDRAFSAGINSSTIGAGSLGALMDNTSALASANKATVASTLAALNPAVYAELGNIGIDRLHDVQAGLSNHLDMLALDAVGEPGLSLGVRVAPPQPQSAPAASAVERARAWTTAYGGWGKRNSDSGFGAAGYSSSNYGDVSGVESKIGDFTIGLTGAVGHSSATFQDGKGSVTADSWHTGVYGSFPAGRLVLDASFVYGQADSTLKRSVDVAGGGATSGKSQGSEWTGQAGFAVPFRTDGDSLMITPSVHVIHASVEQDAITESSLNGLEAAVKGASTTATALRTGVQAAKLTTLGTIATRLTASLDWVHSFDSGRNDVDIALTGAGAETSRFQSSKAGKDAIRFGLGAEFALTDRIRFRLNVDDQVKSGVNSVYSSASIGLQF